jgi:hypothetical protein
MTGTILDRLSFFYRPTSKFLLCSQRAEICSTNPRHPATFHITPPPHNSFEVVSLPGRRLKRMDDDPSIASYEESYGLDDELSCDHQWSDWLDCVSPRLEYRVCNLCLTKQYRERRC